MGNTSSLLEHGPKPWTLLSPGESSSSSSASQNLLRMLNVYKRSKVNRWKSLSVKSIKHKDTTRELSEPKIAGCGEDFQRKCHFLLSSSYTFPQAPALGHCGTQNSKLDGLSASKRSIFRTHKATPAFLCCLVGSASQNPVGES